MSIRSKRTAYAESVTNKSEPTGTPTWSEWLDSDLNSEPWDHPKNGEYNDPQQIQMPLSLQPAKWTRFENLKSVVNPTMFEQIPNYPDFITNNKHLLHSEFVRCFVSTLTNLQYCGRYGLEMENSPKIFSWNSDDESWQGWHHVYSLNKIGKDVPHRPVINPRGRYVVRLFSMGTWRRILIDDLIPVDKKGRPLLPRTANTNEIWPMILAKAMMKVAALSWTSKREIEDCSLISCLTGWICLTLNVSHLSTRDQWEFLTKYAKHFEWSKEEKQEVPTRKSGKSIDSGKSSDLAKSSKIKSKEKPEKLRVPNDPQPITIFLSLEDMRDVDAEEIPGITPCWNHQIYVEMSRDVPLDPSQVKAPLASWKHHRWLDWAIDRGLIDPSEYFVPTRHLLIVSPLGKCGGDVNYTYDENNEDNDYEDEDWNENSSRTTVRSKGQLSDTKRTAVSSESSKDKRGTSSMPDISLWGDFNKLSIYLRQVHLYYKSKFFEHTIEISDVARGAISNDRKRRKSATSDGKSTGKSVTPRISNQEKFYEYQENSLQSGNEPIYVFVDSLKKKNFLVNLSAILFDREDENDSRSTGKTSVIVERYNWFNVGEENPLEVEITTRGTKSTIFQIERGRHLLRIFVSSKFSYRIMLMSDVEFEIGNRLKMHDLMTNECEIVMAIVRKIGIVAQKAFESFGSDTYATDLKNYYRSYMPEPPIFTDKSMVKIVKSIHKYFMEELLNNLKETSSSSELPIITRALRIFFVDPTIGKPVERSNRDRSLENFEEIGYNDDKSATIIQSFFRMIIVKRYQKIHEPIHSEHKQVKEILRKIGKVFDCENGKSIAEKLLRAVVQHENIYRNVYPFVDDLKNVIHIQELKGKISNVSTDRWIPILRIVVNAPESKTVLATAKLFTNLQNYTIRIFDNDTKCEISPAIGNVGPVEYIYKKTGYTIFAYGWNDVRRFKDVEWSLHLTTIKGQPMLHLIDHAQPIPTKIDVPPLTMRQMENNYIPNIRDYIFKLIAIVGNDCFLTLRLTTSYERVMTSIRVTNEIGKIIAEIEGGAVVILPVVFLENSVKNENHVVRESQKQIGRFERSSIDKIVESLDDRYEENSKRRSNDENRDDRTRYFVEAYVRENSWPLTKSEWSVVDREKSKIVNATTNIEKSSTLDLPQKNEKSRSKQSSKKSSRILDPLEKPYWTLQIITDPNDKLEISLDTSKRDRIEKLKKLWKIDDPERCERGRESRQRFLNDNRSIVARSATDLSYRSSTDQADRRESTVGSANEFDVVETSPKSERTIEKPADLGNYLPKLDLTIFMDKDDEEEDCWVKTDYDEETLRNRRAIDLRDFEQTRSMIDDEIVDADKDRRFECVRLYERYESNRANGIRAIDEAYVVRKRYIDATKNTVESSSVKNVGKRRN